jgi:hypothetical protein
VSIIKKEVIAVTFFLAILAVFNVAANAQQAGTIINSDPPGAAITLDGEYKLTATTPCRLPDNITGKFMMKAMMPGYETWSGDIMIIPGQANNFAFNMSAKTRLKAGLRSLFIPGWGQWYGGDKTRAFVVNFATLGFGVGTLIADHDFRVKKDDYDEANSDLANATSYEEITRLRQLVINRNRDAYNAETTRNTFVIITAALWAYNIFDSMVFFPERKLYFHQESIPIKQASIQPNFSLNTVGLTLTATF